MVTNFPKLLKIPNNKFMTPFLWFLPISGAQNTLDVSLCMLVPDRHYVMKYLTWITLNIVWTHLSMYPLTKTVFASPVGIPRLITILISARASNSFIITLWHAMDTITSVSLLSPLMVVIHREIYNQSINIICMWASEAGSLKAKHWLPIEKTSRFTT